MYNCTAVTLACCWRAPRTPLPPQQIYFRVGELRHRDYALAGVTHTSAGARAEVRARGSHAGCVVHACWLAHSLARKRPHCIPRGPGFATRVPRPVIRRAYFASNTSPTALLFRTPVTPHTRSSASPATTRSAAELAHPPRQPRCCTLDG